MSTKKKADKKVEEPKVAVEEKAAEVAPPPAKPVEKKADKKITKPAEKKAEAKKPPEVAETPKAEEPKQEIIPVPDACDAVADGFKSKGKVGYYDPASDDCKACGQEFPEAMKACKHNTELEASLAKAKKKIPKKGEKAPGERTPLGGVTSSGAGKNELLLLRPEGASMEELQANRGAVSSHLADLKKKGFNVEKKDGRYFVKL